MHPENVSTRLNFQPEDAPSLDNNPSSSKDGLDFGSIPFRDELSSPVLIEPSQNKVKGLDLCLDHFHNNLNKNKRDLEDLKIFPGDLVSNRKRKLLPLPQKFGEILDSFKKQMPDQSIQKDFDEILHQVLKKFNEEDLQKLNLVFLDKLPPMIRQVQKSALTIELELKKELEVQKNIKAQLEMEDLALFLSKPPQELLDQLDVRKGEIRKQYEIAIEEQIQMRSSYEDKRGKNIQLLIELELKEKKLNFLRQDRKLQALLKGIYDIFQKKCKKITEIIIKTSWSLKEVKDRFFNRRDEIRKLNIEIKKKHETIDALEMELNKSNKIVYEDKVQLASAKKILYDANVELSKLQGQIKEVKISAKNLIEDNMQIHETLSKESQNVENLEENQKFQESTENIDFTYEVDELEKEEARLIEENTRIVGRVKKSKENARELAEFGEKKRQYEKILEKYIRAQNQVSSQSYSYIYIIYIFLVCLIIAQFKFLQ